MSIPFGGMPTPLGSEQPCMELSSSTRDPGNPFTLTKVKKLKYNAVVEIVFQNTALVGIESHPIRLHGFNFHVLAHGFGNCDAAEDCNKKFNLINPQSRNTISVPVGGKTTIW
ncbi:hypothetical protein L484_023637 [Morus notabilis]|uniref:Plastocyanin-like domain-containing protein n=1 Tax=Morus notabilis TaxID=981085 RepID=W9RGI5_9ROSA|nr:hypothetical protein L484_023637 [Morus notabilis]